MQFYGFGGVPLPAIVRNLHLAQKGAPASDDFVNEFLAVLKSADDEYLAQVRDPAPAISSANRETKSRTSATVVLQC